MKAIKRKGDNKGFTLIEVVLAVGIVAFILTMAYGALSQIMRGKTVLDSTREVYLNAQAVLKRLISELQLTSYDQAGGSGGRGILPPRENLNEPSGPYLLYREDGNGTLTLSFLTFHQGTTPASFSSGSGLTQVTYTLEPEENAPTFTLFREETPYITPPEEAYLRSVKTEVVSGVTRIEFAFFDSETSRWLAEWGVNNETRSRLPKLIKFSFSLEKSDGQLETFTTMVAITNIR